LHKPTKVCCSFGQPSKLLALFHGRCMVDGHFDNRHPGGAGNGLSQVIGLLGPVVGAQSAHRLTSRVRAMDETTIEAGRTEPGKMRTAYCWPVYGSLSGITCLRP